MLHMVRVAHGTRPCHEEWGVQRKGHFPSYRRITRDITRYFRSRRMGCNGMQQKMWRQRSKMAVLQHPKDRRGMRSICHSTSSHPSGSGGGTSRGSGSGTCGASGRGGGAGSGSSYGGRCCLDLPMGSGGIPMRKNSACQQKDSLFVYVPAQGMCSSPPTRSHFAVRT